MTDASHYLLYDAACSVCEQMTTFLVSLDRSHRIRPIPLGHPSVGRLLAGIPPEKRLGSFHLVRPGGEVSTIIESIQYAPARIEGASDLTPVA